MNNYTKEKKGPAKGKRTFKKRWPNNPADREKALIRAYGGKPPYWI
jgi:hypothetical protein